MDSKTANDSIQTECKETIEQILQFYECDSSIRLKMMIETAGSKEGDNYMSVVKRLIVSGCHDTNQNQNEIYKRSIIVKRQIPNLARRKLFRADQAFANEIIAYSKVTPQLHQFADSIELPLPLVDCLFAGADDQGELIVLDDLKQYGYRMANRLKGLDYSHCKYVLQELAAHHGVSLAAKQLHPMDFGSCVSNIGEAIYCEESFDFFAASLECSLKEALFSLRKSSKTYPNLNTAIYQVEKLKGQLFRKMYNCVWDTRPDWRVICHGDLWINNLMFKYNCRGECDGVKFVDLQTLRYTSPAIDILHFLYTSTEFAVRDQYYDQLIDDYVDALYKTLQKFEVQDYYVPNVQALNTIIRQEIRDKALYGLGVCMWLMPAVTFHPDNILDLDTVTAEDFASDNQEKTLTQMQTSEYHVRMRDTILEFYQRGIFDDLV